LQPENVLQVSIARLSHALVTAPLSKAVVFYATRSQRIQPCLIYPSPKASTRLQQRKTALQQARSMPLVRIVKAA